MIINKDIQIAIYKKFKAILSWYLGSHPKLKTFNSNAEVSNGDEMNTEHESP